MKLSVTNMFIWKVELLMHNAASSRVPALSLMVLKVNVQDADTLSHKAGYSNYSLNHDALSDICFKCIHLYALCFLL